jgi:hypothetical protein
VRYHLIQRRRGKDTVVMTDELPKVNARRRTLTASHRKGVNGDPVTYRVEAAGDADKFKQKPHDICLHSGGSGRHPRVPRKGS